MSGHTLLNMIEQEREEIIDLMQLLVEHESPSQDKNLVDRLGVFIAERLEQYGLFPQFIPRSEVGDILWAEWGNEIDEVEGRVLFLCHIDTVWSPGSLLANPFRLEQGKIYGPGIFDMKAGVAATLKVCEYISQGWIRPRKKIRFLFTTDEEVNSFHSRTIIEEFAAESDSVMVMEPPLPGGGLKTCRSGVGTYRLNIQGKSAHTGLDPEKGISAVEELARQVLYIKSLSEPEVGTYVTVNVVQGGTVCNVIPENAEALIDTRFRTLEEGQRVDRELRQHKTFLPGVRLQIDGLIDRPPLLKSKKSLSLFRLARQISQELEFDLEEGESGGGSDGNFTAALGIPTLDGLGFPGDGAHAQHEHIEISGIAPRLALLALLAERL